MREIKLIVEDDVADLFATLTAEERKRVIHNFRDGILIEVLVDKEEIEYGNTDIYRDIAPDDDGEDVYMSDGMYMRSDGTMYDTKD